MENIGGAGLEQLLRFINGKPVNAVAKKGVVTSGSEIDQPKFSNLYISLRGYRGTTGHLISVLCGDNPPEITDGYGKWSVVDRPLRTGITTFQGYNPATMKIELKFGSWDEAGWHIDQLDPRTGRQINPPINGVPNGFSTVGQWVEDQIAKLGWMAGANGSVGAPPYVYANTYGTAGGTTNLIPYQYQETAAGKSVTDTKNWPWVINGGIQWGKSYRNADGDRVYQECSFTLLNFLGFTKPQQFSKSGGYFTSSQGRDDCLLIAGAPSAGPAMDVQNLARTIMTDPKNNPMRRSRTHLSNIGLRGKIKHGLQVWIPEHNA